MTREVRLDHLLGVYAVGSGDWSWQVEYDELIGQPGTQKLLARIRNEGIREPVLLGTDGRVWDGHHRIVIAMHLGLDSVPVEFAGEGSPERRREEVLNDVRMAVNLALALASWPCDGEEYDATPMIRAVTENLLGAWGLGGQATDSQNRSNP